ncbi:3-isopropylmalate dehydratase small subunit [Paenarthrobacter sp. A20]|uniref:3-isopropylmalate dehydratase small subunit n=1 Tax=Paenarthrobacter sp. A20 TaxID=2817891 RepID=UPI0020A06C56|nr:3-isopropylmalate dehydratase small subunit [Paenarthrobacter sp. A20]MCP1415575.1 3-isopropylmalate/(R)-2-methylmalate dehydratase small subunit [Paenarthrobacter sp. A20]
MPFQAVTAVQGTAVPLRRTNVDTDQIIPAVYMKRITRTGYEDGLFAGWRKDPNFVLNRPEYEGGIILVAGPDFGTGSSREHAVWALMDYGFKAVLSPRFADIFRGNAGKAGLLAAQVSEESLLLLWDELERNPQTAVTLDLGARTVEAGGVSTTFQLDDDTRRRLMNGLDDIDLTLQDDALIAAFEKRRPPWLPVTTPVSSK